MNFSEQELFRMDSVNLGLKRHLARELRENGLIRSFKDKVTKKQVLLRG